MLILQRFTAWLGGRLARYLARPRHLPGGVPPGLVASLRPGDVLLVEGSSRFSTGVKYLTQSTWSHAALYVGDRFTHPAANGERLRLIDVDVVDGVRAIALQQFAGLSMRICRPVGLDAAAIEAVIGHAMARLGHHYDLKNIIDLVRWLLPTPPVPTRWRRRLLTLGSGDPTRAICSTLIAEAFQSVQYPILPRVEQRPLDDPDCPACVEEVLHRRHHSLFVPRDFDLSPYFEIVKPTLVGGFDPRQLRWAQVPAASAPSAVPEVSA